MLDLPCAGSAFFRYGRDKTTQTRDFPRQFGLNFKPLLLSLSGAMWGSQETKQCLGSCPTATNRVPRNPPSPFATTHDTLYQGQVGQSARAGGNSRQPSATAGTSVFLSWVALQLSEAVERLRDGLTPRILGIYAAEATGATISTQPELKLSPQSWDVPALKDCFLSLPFPFSTTCSLLLCFHFCICSPFSSLPALNFLKWLQEL